jgi:hypothetical protein
MIVSTKRTMGICRGRINAFFGAVLLGGVLAASPVQSAEPPKDAKAAKVDKAEQDPSKQASTVRLHMETEAPGMGTGKIKVLRTNPVEINVEKDPFLDEGFLERASVLDTVGGHMILLKFTQQGALRLQMWTVAKTGRRIAVWARWTEGRWLGAPVAARALEDGILAFTPDATREEAERIVRGLNNVAVKLGNQKKPEKPKQQSIGKAGKKAPAGGKTDEEEMFQK